ncbi:MAG TPA: hypothetical protein VI452_06545, partial [Marmoricola sp.]
PGPSAALPLIGAITAPPHAPARSRPSDGQQAAASPHPVTEAMLLDADQLRRAAPRNDWVVWSTSDNSGGTGLNTACQATRFADPHGLAAFVRTFDATGRPRRSAVQTVEVSRTRAAAAAAYATMLRWYADCTRTHAQLVAAFRVSGLGDAARVLTLRLAGHRWYDVGVARSGAVTTLTVLQTRRGGAVGPHATSADLATAVQRLCGADDAGTCTSAPPRLVPSLPRVGGERVGMLATADLPFVDHLARPWVGTRPTATRSNVAATPCDRTDFHALGARRAVTRTFLVPQARLPERFGLSETYGAFAGGGRATAALHRVQRRMAACSRSDLGARVRHARVVAHSSHGSSYGLWRVEVEVTAHRRVSYWMGVARVGRYLAQVTFSPVPGKDVGAPVFEALVERARDRLLELP